MGIRKHDDPMKMTAADRRLVKRNNPPIVGEMLDKLAEAGELGDLYRENRKAARHFRAAREALVEATLLAEELGEHRDIIETTGRLQTEQRRRELAEAERDRLRQELTNTVAKSAVVVHSGD